MDIDKSTAPKMLPAFDAKRSRFQKFWQGFVYRLQQRSIDPIACRQFKRKACEVFIDRADRQVDVIEAKLQLAALYLEDDAFNRAFNLFGPLVEPFYKSVKYAHAPLSLLLPSLTENTAQLGIDAFTHMAKIIFASTERNPLIDYQRLELLNLCAENAGRIKTCYMMRHVQDNMSTTDISGNVAYLRESATFVKKRITEQASEIPSEFDAFFRLIDELPLVIKGAPPPRHAAQLNAAIIARTLNSPQMITALANYSAA